MMKGAYKYIDSYGFEDSDFFFGREKEVKRMVSEIISTRLLVLFSPSGSGKSSLINAGVRPTLENLGYKTVYALCDDNPIISIKNSVSKELKLPKNIESEDLHTFLTYAVDLHLKKDVDHIKPSGSIVIFLDQFEEFFIILRNKPKHRKEFFKQLLSIKKDEQLQVSVVISIRDNYYVNLFEFRNEIAIVFKNSSLRLRGLSINNARHVIEEPAKKLGVNYEEKLIDSVVNELKNNHNCIDMLPLQLVCHSLWVMKRENEKEIRFKDYKLAGGTKKILQHRIFTMIETIPKEYHKLLSKMFTKLRTKDGKRRYISRRQLFIDLVVYRKNLDKTRYLLNKLVSLNILNREQHINSVWYEIKHDYLVNEINEWTIKYQKHKKRRLQLHGTTVSFAILCCLFFLWIFTMFNQFKAGFTDQIYENQQQEVVITRRFNPFNFKVTTGIFKKDLKNTDSLNLIKNRYLISNWNKNNWYKLFEILDVYKSGYLMYKAGLTNEGIKKLIMALKNDDLLIRVRATEAFKRISKTERTIIENLISTLRKNDYDFHAQFSDTIAQIEIIIRETVESNAVSERAGRDKLAIREEKVIINQSLINSLINILKEKRDKGSIDKLVKLGKSDDNVSVALINAFKEGDTLLKSGVMEVLIKLGKNSKNVTTALINALEDKNANIRMEATNVLVAIGQRDQTVIKSLITVLNDNDPYVRNMATESMLKLGQSTLQVITTSILALTDSDNIVRLNATLELGEIGRINNEVVNALLSLIEDKYGDRSFYVLRKASDLLVKLSSCDQRTIDALITTLQDKEFSVRVGSANALGKIGNSDQKVITALITALADSKPDVWMKVMDALAQLGKSNKNVINALIRTINDENSSVRSKALETLGKIGSSEDKVINSFITSLHDNRYRVRASAANALGTLGNSDKLIIAELVAVTKDKASNVRAFAFEALGKLGQRDQKVIKTLITGMKDEDDNVRISALEALGKLGRSDDQIIEALILAINDKNSSVKERAEKVLGELLQSISGDELLIMLSHNLSGYRRAAVEVIKQKQSISLSLENSVKKLKNKKKNPWIRIAAWNAYEIICERRKTDKTDAYNDSSLH